MSGSKRVTMESLRDITGVCSALANALRGSGLSVAEVSRRSGMSYRTLFGIMHGEGNPRGRTIFKIATALETTPHDLLLRNPAEKGGKMPTAQIAAGAPSNSTRDPEKADLCGVVSEAINASGLTPTDVGRRAGIAYGTIHEIMHGRANPRGKTIFRIATALGTTPRDLLSRNPAEKGGEIATVQTAAGAPIYSKALDPVPQMELNAIEWDALADRARGMQIEAVCRAKAETLRFCATMIRNRANDADRRAFAEEKTRRSACSHQSA